MTKNGKCPECNKEAVYNGVFVIGLNRPKGSDQYIAIHRECFSPYVIGEYSKENGIEWTLWEG